ncbi:MAG: hypothetical protein IT340_12395 [Chloroflexi bacterium]|nr:hypothetical protein [Chloroflexota bacterium]
MDPLQARTQVAGGGGSVLILTRAGRRRLAAIGPELVTIIRGVAVDEADAHQAKERR